MFLKSRKVEFEGKAWFTDLGQEGLVSFGLGSRLGLRERGRKRSDSQEIESWEESHTVIKYTLVFH